MRDCRTPRSTAVQDAGHGTCHATGSAAKDTRHPTTTRSMRGVPRGDGACSVMCHARVGTMQHGKRCERTHNAWHHAWFMGQRVAAYSGHQRGGSGVFEERQGRGQQLWWWWCSSSFERGVMAGSELRGFCYGAEALMGDTQLWACGFQLALAMAQ